MKVIFVIPGVNFINQSDQGGAMFRSFIIIFAFSFLFPQTHSDFYSGELSFDYSGSLNGSFHAELIDPDSLSLTNSGAIAFITSDSVSSRITVPAIQPSNDELTEFDLFLMWMIDDGTDIEPQSWDVSIPDLEDPLNTPATYLFIPEIDSSLIFDIIGPLLDGEVDSTNFSDFFLETITDLIGQAFLPLSGNIELEQINDEFMLGNFAGTLFQAGFPPPMVFVTNGLFDLSAPGMEMVPEAPADFTGEIINNDVWLQWSLSAMDTLSGFTNIYRSMNDLGFEIYADLAFPESEFFDSNVDYGATYSYYLTASNFLGIESETTDTLTFFLQVLLPGDINEDGVVDVLDIVNLVNFILGGASPTDEEFQRADINIDGVLDVLDIVLMVNMIIDGQ